MTHILGISAFYHDSAAVLVTDGHIVAAAQEERFTRVKHDAGFPTQAVKFCLETGQIRAEDLDFIVFYEKPLLRFERLLEGAVQQLHQHQKIIIMHQTLPFYKQYLKK